MPPQADPLSSAAVQSALSELTTAVTHAAIHPWWSSLSSNDKTLEVEVHRLARLAGREIHQRALDAQWKPFLAHQVPLLLTQFIRVSRTSRGSFAVYNAIWPSRFVRQDGSVDTERVKKLAGRLIVVLLPPEERRSAMAQEILADVLAMVIRVALERGSCAWMWVRVMKKALDGRSASGHRGADTAKSTLKEKPDRSTASSLLSALKQAYRRWKTSDARPSSRSATFTANYLYLLATLFDLASTYTGRLTLAVTQLISRYLDVELDRVLKSLLVPLWHRESTWLRMISSIRDAILPNGTQRFPARTPDPSVEEQQREYDGLVGSLLAYKADSNRMWLVKAALLGGAGDEDQQRQQLQSVVLDPLLHPRAQVHRADLIARLLESLCVLLVPEFAQAGPIYS